MQATTEQHIFLGLLLALGGVLIYKRRPTTTYDPNAGSTTAATPVQSQFDTGIPNYVPPNLNYNFPTPNVLPGIGPVAATNFIPLLTVKAPNNWGLLGLSPGNPTAQPYLANANNPYPACGCACDDHHTASNPGTVVTTDPETVAAAINDPAYSYSGPAPVRFNAL